MEKKYFHLSSLLLTFAILLAACGGAASTATQSTNSTNGGNGSPAPVVDFVLDPANSTSENARAAVGYMYEGLVRIQDGAPVGALAESFSVSEDGLDYIFNLRSGVSFHDGSALNADLVVANFNRWFDPNDVNRGSSEFSAWKDNFGGFKGETGEDGKAKSEYDGIEKVNDLTVLVHLNTPDPDFLTKLAGSSFAIASPNSFKNGGDGGSGPYMATGKSGADLTLAPFSGYWDSSLIPGKEKQVPIE